MVTSVSKLTHGDELQVIKSHILTHFFETKYQNNPYTKLLNNPVCIFKLTNTDVINDNT